MTQDQLQQSQQTTSRQGDLGEQFALAFERKRLPEYLCDNITHFAEHEIALGYDILSFETSTSILPDRYIEVKTFRGHPHFYWSENEIAAARKYSEHYYLYLIDIDRISEPDYEPQIIPNPAVLFDQSLPENCTPDNPENDRPCSPRPTIPAPCAQANGQNWTFRPIQFAFSLTAEANIPQDWDTATILLGCYNNEQHLRWILDHNLYNVRAERPTNSLQKSVQKMAQVPGSIALSPVVASARYLILYSAGTPRCYKIFELTPSPFQATRQHLVNLAYPNPHCPNYVLHPIARQLPSFHIDLPQLLRDANPKDATFVGTPLYLTGIQLRRFMPHPTNPAPINPPAITANSEPHMAPQAPTSSRYQAPHERPSMVAEPIRPYPASRQGLPWTSADETLLLAHLQQHTPVAKIAPLLKRSEKAIVRRMGVLRRRNTITFALYIHYYDNDPAFALHCKTKASNSTIHQ